MSENSGGPTPTPAKEGDGHGQKKRRGQGNRGPTTTKFEGAVPLLKDYVYDVTSARNGKDSFQRTTEAIGEHIARTYKQGGEFVQAFNPTNLGFAPITDPTRPADPTDVFDMEQWKIDIRRASDKRKDREELCKQAYAVVIGQCSRTVRDRLQGSTTWNTIHAQSDVISLLKLIRTSLFSGATSRHHVHALQEAQDDFMSLYQHHRMSNAMYLERFKDTYAVYKHLGGKIGLSDDDQGSGS